MLPPPILFFSTNTVLNPNIAKAEAIVIPAAPAPITQISYFLIMVAFPIVMGVVEWLLERNNKAARGKEKIKFAPFIKNTRKICNKEVKKKGVGAKNPAFLFDKKPFASYNTDFRK